MALAFGSTLFAADKGLSEADKKFFTEAASVGMMEAVVVKKVVAFSE